LIPVANTTTGDMWLPFVWCLLEWPPPRYQHIMWTYLPVHRHLKFSQVLGHTSADSSKTTLPATHRGTCGNRKDQQLLTWGTDVQWTTNMGCQTTHEFTYMEHHWWWNQKRPLEVALLFGRTSGYDDF